MRTPLFLTLFVSDHLQTMRKRHHFLSENRRVGRRPLIGSKFSHGAWEYWLKVVSQNKLTRYEVLPTSGYFVSQEISKILSRKIAEKQLVHGDEVSITRWITGTPKMEWTPEELLARRVKFYFLIFENPIFRFSI